MPSEISQPNPEQNFVVDKAMAEEMAHAEDRLRSHANYLKRRGGSFRADDGSIYVGADAPERALVEAEKAGDAARQRYENPNSQEQSEQGSESQWKVLQREHESHQQAKQRGKIALYGAPGGYVQGEIVSGGPGGPAIIQTPGGKVAVEKLSIP